MTFDQFWEEAHATRQWGKYPNEQFVRFMMGNYKNVADRKQVKVLEIGSGGGANIWFVGKEGFDAYAFDASPSGVKNSIKFLEDEKVYAQVITADAENIENIFPEIEFDVIFDICTLSHIKYDESTVIVDKVYSRLKKGGHFFSITFGKGSWGDGLGKEIAKNCYSSIPEGPFVGINVVQLMDVPSLENWGSKFSSHYIEELSATTGNRAHVIKHLLMVGKK